MSNPTRRFRGPKNPHGRLVIDRAIWRPLHLEYRSVRCPLLMGRWKNQSLRDRILWKPFDRLWAQQTRRRPNRFRGANRLYWRARTAFLAHR